jgi:catalase
VETIHEEAHLFRTRIKQAQDGTYDLRQDRKPVSWPKIPADFPDFVASMKKKEGTKKKKNGKRGR